MLVREWFSGETYHFRGVVELTTVTGDLEGSITAVLNGDINLRTGTGSVSGPFTLVTSDVTWTGTFRGTRAARAHSSPKGPTEARSTAHSFRRVKTPWRTRQ